MFELADQLGDVRSSHPPDQAIIDFPIFVRQNIALRDNLPPGDFRMSGLKTPGNPVRSFADYLDVPFNRPAKHSVTCVILK